MIDRFVLLSLLATAVLSTALGATMALWLLCPHDEPNAPPTAARLGTAVALTTLDAAAAA